MGGAGARTRRSLGHHLLHPLILRLRVLFYKPWISALIWDPESGRGIIRRAPRSLAVKSIGAREVKKVILGQEGVTAS